MTKRQLFSLLLAGLVLLTGCALASDNAREQPSVTPVPTEDSPEPEPTQAALDPLLALLTGVGAEVAILGQQPHDLFDAGAWDVMVDGAGVRVYVFPGVAEREAASSGLSEDGFEIRTDDSVTHVDWIDVPHFWATDRFLVQYVGRDQAIIERLDAAFGPQIADGSPADRPEPTAPGTVDTTLEEASPGLEPPAGLVYQLFGDGLWWIAADGRPEQLTEAEAMPSPRLTRAAYVDWASGDRFVEVLNLGDDTSHTVEVPERLVGCYAWQGEDHLLCGVRFATEDDGPNLGHLTRIQVADGQVEIIDRDHLLFSPPAVSHDGQNIAFEGSEGVILLWQDGRTEELDWGSFDGIPDSKSAWMHSFSFSPEGRQIAAYFGAGQVSLVILDLDAKTARLLHPFEPVGFGGWFPPAVWSPDGRWLAAQVLAYPPEAGGLWLIATDGSQEVQLGGVELHSPVWASDTTVLFTNAAEGKLSAVEQADLTTGAIDRLAVPEGSSVVAVSQ